MIIRKRAECWMVSGGKIWVGIKNGKIIIPGGTLEDEETPEQAAVRETKEEIGVTAKNLKLITEDFIIKDSWNGWTHSKTYSYKADFGGIDESTLGDGPEGSFHRTHIPINKLINYYKKMLNNEDHFKDIAKQNLRIIKYITEG